MSVLDEDQLDADKSLLAKEITLLLTKPKETAAMAHRFKAFSKPNAAKDMAQLILKAAH